MLLLATYTDSARQVTLDLFRPVSLGSLVNGGSPAPIRLLSTFGSEHKRPSHHFAADPKGPGGSFVDFHRVAPAFPVRILTSRSVSDLLEKPGEVAWASTV